MSILRTIIDQAVAETIADHPKWFSEKGRESARRELVRKIMAAFRDGGGEKDDAAPEPVETPKHIMAAIESNVGRAYINLRVIAGAAMPTCISSEIVVPSVANCEAVLALADMPDRKQWPFVSDRQQIGAWVGFFDTYLPNIARRPIKTTCNGESGIWVPWPWPPAKDGKTYERDEAA